MNTFLDHMKAATNYKITENGAVSHKSTLDAVYDLFALGGAYRDRTVDDKEILFKKAFSEDPDLALKCLFWMRDCRGGNGERDFFRVCFNYLCRVYPQYAENLLHFIPIMGRWDDVVYSTWNTPVWTAAIDMIRKTLDTDTKAEHPSQLAKWLPSANASSVKTKTMAASVRKALGMTENQYRKTLSLLRKRINLVETTMSERRWEDIDFGKLPSKAGLKYRKAFALHQPDRYEEFLNSNQKVNAGTLYPYEIVQKVFCHTESFERASLNKYWENLPDYFEGKECPILCMIDTSGSMFGNPMNVAISLGLYCAERNRGPFKDVFMTFSSNPQLVQIHGHDFVDKVNDIYRNSIIANTDLIKAFDLLYSIALDPTTDPADIPKTLVVISDMEIDRGTFIDVENDKGDGLDDFLDENRAVTEMERMRKKWEAASLKMPRLVYWNVDARNDTILDSGPDVTFVSGCSPILFKAVISDKSGKDVMIDTLMSDRYKDIHT